MRSFSKLAFDFSVLLQFKAEKFKLLLHFYVLVVELLDMLRLVLELARELNVLLHSKLGGALKLVIVHGEHFDLDIPDIHEHLLPQRLNGSRSLRLDLVQVPLVLLTTLVELIFKQGFFHDFLCFEEHPVFNVSELFLFGLDLRVLLLSQDNKLSVLSFDLLFMIFMRLPDFFYDELGFFLKFFETLVVLVYVRALPLNCCHVLILALVALVLELLAAFGKLFVIHS